MNRRNWLSAAAAALLAAKHVETEPPMIVRPGAPEPPFRPPGVSRSGFSRVVDVPDVNPGSLTFTSTAGYEQAHIVQLPSAYYNDVPWSYTGG